MKSSSPLVLISLNYLALVSAAPIPMRYESYDYFPRAPPIKLLPDRVYGHTFGRDIANPHPVFGPLPVFEPPPALFHHPPSKSQPKQKVRPAGLDGKHRKRRKHKKSRNRGDEYGWRSEGDELYGEGYDPLLRLHPSQQFQTRPQPAQHTGSHLLQTQTRQAPAGHHQPYPQQFPSQSTYQHPPQPQFSQTALAHTSRPATAPPGGQYYDSGDLYDEQQLDLPPHLSWPPVAPNPRSPYVSQQRNTPHTQPTSRQGQLPVDPRGIPDPRYPSGPQQPYAQSMKAQRPSAQLQPALPTNQADQHSSFDPTNPLPAAAGGRPPVNGYHGQQQQPPTGHAAPPEGLQHQAWRPDTYGMPEQVQHQNTQPSPRPPMGYQGSLYDSQQQHHQQPQMQGMPTNHSVQSLAAPQGGQQPYDQSNLYGAQTMPPSLLSSSQSHPAALPTMQQHNGDGSYGMQTNIPSYSLQGPQGDRQSTMGYQSQASPLPRSMPVHFAAQPTQNHDGNGLYGMWGNNTPYPLSAMQGGRPTGTTAN